jgi:hypothetical protein
MTSSMLTIISSTMMYRDEASRDPAPHTIYGFLMSKASWGKVAFSCVLLSFVLGIGGLALAYRESTDGFGVADAECQARAAGSEEVYRDCLAARVKLSPLGVAAPFLVSATVGVAIAAVSMALSRRSERDDAESQGL